AVRPRPPPRPHLGDRTAPAGARRGRSASRGARLGQSLRPRAGGRALRRLMPVLRHTPLPSLPLKGGGENSAPAFLPPPPLRGRAGVGGAARSLYPRDT